jgi:hypothetical protein
MTTEQRAELVRQYELAGHIDNYRAAELTEAAPGDAPKKWEWQLDAGDIFKKTWMYDSPTYVVVKLSKKGQSRTERLLGDDAAANAYSIAPNMWGEIEIIDAGHNA